MTAGKSYYVSLVCGVLFLLAASSAHADDYFVYSTFDPPEAGYSMDSAGSYVEDYGVPGTWGDEIQYVYFTAGSVGYKYKVWVKNEGSAADPTPFIDIKQHPDHYDPSHIGPVEPRYFEFVSSANLSYSGSHADEFHIDSTGVYLGAYPYGIHKWDHDWNYVEKIANVPPERTESLAYNPGEDVWYAGGRYRTIYQLRDTNGDGSFLDESWTSIFTHPNYGGNHHDGMEFVGGYLWISDMTSDVIAKWGHDVPTDTWFEVGLYYYSEPAYVEGMGFGANDHFWLTGSNNYFYELGNKITMYYPLADAGEDVTNYPPTVPLEFDASGSHHTDPDRKIVLYEWDFDGDGVYDYSGTEPVVEHTYPAVYNPDGSIDWGATARCYTAMLRVTDDDPVMPKTAADIRGVCITAPPWKPIADPDGPYNTKVNQDVCLDGSASIHPADKLYESGHPWFDEIVLWEWDLDNDGQFDDATGKIVCTQWPTEDTYFVSLRVTDGAGASDAKGTTVIIAPGIHDVATGNPTLSKSADILPGEIITVGVTVSNLGDYPESFDVTLNCDGGVGLIDTGSVIDLGPGQQEDLSFSWDTTGIPVGLYTLKICADTVAGELIVANNCHSTSVDVVNKMPPVADAADPYQGIEGIPVTFDASSSNDPDGSIVLYEWDWDNDGTYDYSTTNPVCIRIWWAEYDGLVTLRTTDNDGLQDTDKASVVINSGDLSDLVHVSLDTLRHSRATDQSSVAVTITNTSNKIISSPLRFAVKSVSPPGVTLVSPGGITQDGYTSYDIAGLLGDGKLSPGETIATRVFFANPARERFTFTVGVYGLVLP